MSAASNYNTFYSSLMSGEIASARLKSAQVAFEANLKAAETAIQRENRLPAIRRDINKELALLANEIQNSKKGYGPEAKRYIDSIIGQLQAIQERIAVFTPPPPPGTDASNRAALSDFSGRVEAALIRAEAANPWSRGHRALDNAREDYNTAVRAARAAPASDNGEADRMAVEKISEITRRIESAVLQIFDTSNMPRPALSLVPVSSEGMKLYDLAESIRSGFHERPNIWKTGLAAAAAVLIDVLPLIFALVLIRPRKRKTAGSGPEDREDDAEVFRDPITGPHRPREVYKRPEIISGQEQRKSLRKTKG